MVTRKPVLSRGISKYILQTGTIHPSTVSRKRPLAIVAASFFLLACALSVLDQSLNSKSSWSFRKLRSQFRRVYPPDWRRAESVYTSYLLSQGYIGVANEYYLELYPQDRKRATSESQEPLNQTWLDAFDNVTIAKNSILPVGLANTTFMPLNHASMTPYTTAAAYRGIDCADHYPAQICPLPGMCAPAHPDSASAQIQLQSSGPCQQWRTGALSSLELGLRAIQESHGVSFSSAGDEQRYVDRVKGAMRDESYGTTDWDTDGQWQGEEWWPARDPFGDFRRFNPSDIHQCFVGKDILLQGDASIRQIYLRLINYLRGIPTSAEKVFVGNSTYTVFLNGTDSLHTPGPEVTLHEGLYRIHFDWHEFSFSSNFNKYALYAADHVLLGLNYLWPSQSDFWPLRREVDRLFAKEYQGTLTWFATPPISKSLEDRDTYAMRNRIVRQHVAERQWQNGTYRMNVIPTDNVYKVENGWPFSRNHWPIDGANTLTGCTLIEGSPIPGLQGMIAPVGDLWWICLYLTDAASIAGLRLSGHDELYGFTVVVEQYLLDLATSELGLYVGSLDRDTNRRR